MLILITFTFGAVASAAVAVEYWRWLQRRSGIEPEEQARGHGGERRLSLVTESLAAVGAILVLAGTGVTIAQRWLLVTDWGRFGILASVAIGFLIAGFAVRWMTGSATAALTELMWCLSAGCVAAAAAIAAAAIYSQTARVTIVIAGAALALYAAVLWLLCRREVLMVTAFAGLIGAMCCVVLEVATDAAPWLAAALGLWLLGTAWVFLGWRYPEPLGTSLPVGAVLALAGPALVVRDNGWVYVIAIATAAAVMAASVPLRNVVLTAFGSCALFSYITAAVLRYTGQSLGVSESLVVIGLVLIALAIATVRVGRATRPHPPRPHHPDAGHADGRKIRAA